MQQNVAAAGSNHIARVQFPEELAAADIPRPPSARPIPRVGSQNKVPTTSASVGRYTSNMGSGEDIGRTRSPSFNNPPRSELGLGYPTSVLNPSRRRSSAQQIHRKKDSTETYDPSRYDLDDAAEQYRNPNEGMPTPVIHAEPMLTFTLLSGIKLCHNLNASAYGACSLRRRPRTFEQNSCSKATAKGAS